MNNCSQNTMYFIPLEKVKYELSGDIDDVIVQRIVLVLHAISLNNP